MTEHKIKEQNPKLRLSKPNSMSKKPFLPNKVLMPRPIESDGINNGNVMKMTNTFLCLKFALCNKKAIIVERIVQMIAETKEQIAEFFTDSQNLLSLMTKLKSDDEI